MDRTSTPEDTVGAVRSVVQKQTVAFGFGRYRESPGVQAILRSLDIERDGADSKGVRPLTLTPSTLPFSSRRSTDNVHNSRRCACCSEPGVHF